MMLGRDSEAKVAVKLSQPDSLLLNGGQQTGYPRMV